MARSRELRVVVTGDASDLKRSLRSSEADLTRFQRQGSKTLDHLKTAGLAAGAALGGGLVLGLKASVQATIEAEKSQAKLRAQLDTLGISYKAHAAEIENVIQKTSRLAAVDDEDLQDAFTNIVRVTGNVKQSLNLVGLAADISRAKNIDLAKAGELVGKVAGGNTGILQRYGIRIKEGATAQEALAAAQKKFGGQAEAYGKTTAGSIDRAKVAVENLEEKIGKALAPTVRDIADKLSKFVDGMDKGTGAGGRFVRKVEDITDKLKAVAGFLKDHPGLVAAAAAAWAAFKVTFGVRKFAAAFAKTIPVAAAQGAAAGAAYTTGAGATGGGFAGGATKGIGQAAAKGSRLERAFISAGRGLGSAFGIAAAAMIGAEIMRELVARLPNIKVNIPGIGPVGFGPAERAGDLPGATNPKKPKSLFANPDKKRPTATGSRLATASRVPTADRRSAHRPAAPPRGPALFNSMVSGDRVSPEMGKRLQAMAVGTGRSIHVQSGLRTVQQQAALVNSKGLYGPGNPTGAAAPSSNAPHVRGVAADITPGREVFGGVAAKYGLAFPLGQEPWHVEISGAGGGGGTTGGAVPVSLGGGTSLGGASLGGLTGGGGVSDARRTERRITAGHRAAARRQQRRNVREQRERMPAAGSLTALGYSQAAAEDLLAQGDPAGAYIEAVATQSRIDQINRALRRKNLSPKRRAALLRERAGLTTRATELEKTYGPQPPEPPEEAGEDPNQALIDSNTELAAVIQAQVDALRDVADEVKALTDIQTRVANVDVNVLKQAIADAASGQIGGQLLRAFGTPGFAGGSMAY